MCVNYDFGIYCQPWRILLPTGTKYAQVLNPPRNISVSKNFVDFRSLCVSCSIPAVVPLILSPLPRCYHTYSTRYRGYSIVAVLVPVVTAVIPQHVVPITAVFTAAISPMQLSSSNVILEAATLRLWVLFVIII